MDQREDERRYQEGDGKELKKAPGDISAHGSTKPFLFSTPIIRPA